MTSLAKLEANRSNAKLSTGPRTKAGKGAVARNAIRHGIFANLPVVAGESPYEWDQHRAGIVASLDPIGLLESSLAQRVALILWRLARLARFESGVTNANVEDAGLLNPELDPFLATTHPSPNVEDYLKLTNEKLRQARVNLDEILTMAHLLRRVSESVKPDAYRNDQVVSLLQWAFHESYDYAFRRFDPAHPTEPGFLAQLGVSVVSIKDVVWTLELILRGFDYYAGASDATAATFQSHMQKAINERVAALDREVRRLEGETNAIVRRSELSRARAADAALLPREQTVEMIMKYERHLQNQLNSTLHELERLQARRAGTPVAPPLVADVQVTVVQDLP